MYYLKPTGKNENMHQIVNADFEFQRKLPEDKGFEKADSIASPKGKSVIGIKILKPGAFQLQFAITKYDLKNKKSISKEIVSPALLFNAVTITASISDKDLGKFSYDFFNSHTKIQRKYEFLINTGNRSYDNSIYPEPIDYLVSAFNYKGKLKGGQVVNFRDNWEGWIMDYKPTVDAIDIQLTQTTPNGQINIIEYKNIPCNKY